VNTAVLAISNLQLAVGLIFIILAGILSLVHSLGLEKDLFIGTVRTFVQLFLLGFALKFVFSIDRVWLVVLVFVLMILFAAWTIKGRVRERQVSFFWPVFLSMCAGYFFIAFMVTGVIVNAEPWWRPQYFIPLSGMVIGNSMNAMAISLERLLGDLRGRRGEVEMLLCLGADYREASQNIFRDAMRAGMIPSINSMMAVGVVFIPGMMTGQILAGADPVSAIRYQIVVMVMLVGATALGSFMVLSLVRRRCFGPAQQLLLKQTKHAG